MTTQLICDGVVEAQRELSSQSLNVSPTRGTESLKLDGLIRDGRMTLSQSRQFSSGFVAPTGRSNSLSILLRNAKT